MDSLLATYASSDEEEDQQQSPQKQQQPVSSDSSSKFSGNFFSSLPPPKSSSQSPFSSLPPPKSQISNLSPQTLTSKPASASSIPKKQDEEKPKFSSLFSSLPQPKSERSDPFSLEPKPKKVVQFRPPINPSLVKDEDDDDDKEEEKKKSNAVPQVAPSVKSFLSSIPAPRNSASLGALPSSGGTGRRSILEADVPALSNSVDRDQVTKSADHQVKYDHQVDYAVSTGDSSNLVSSTSEGYVNYDDNTYGVYGNVSAGNENYVNYDNSIYGGYANVGTDHPSYGPAAPATDGYVNYGSYGDYGNYEQYESKWIDRSSGALEPEVSGGAVESFARVPGKRGRNEIPQEVIEVKQDELMKNRPREDQVKMTGIAFGPAYQPASSAKGKPSKLHKRKHQIGSLYFDMRSKEMELAERRSKGFLTKAETQAKYGW